MGGGPDVSDERHETRHDPGDAGADRVRLPEVDEGSADLDEESYRRLTGKRRQRLLRQRVVFGIVVLLVLCAGGGAALVWTGRWDPGADDRASTAATAPACATPAPAPLLAPAEVSVEVLNGTARKGLAATVAGELRTRGFVVSRVANAPVAAGPVTATVSYPAASLPQARAVAARIPEAALAEDPAATAVTVSLGDGYQQLLAEDALAAPAAAPAPVAGC